MCELSQLHEFSSSFCSNSLKQISVSQASCYIGINSEPELESGIAITYMDRGGVQCDEEF
jgi:hypothetical protein